MHICCHKKFIFVIPVKSKTFTFCLSLVDLDFESVCYSTAQYGLGSTYIVGFIRGSIIDYSVFRILMWDRMDHTHKDTEASAAQQ